MGRPSGSRNPNFEAKREALAERVMEHLIQTGVRDASMRELATACDVTPPTLRHYFGDREGLLEAAFEVARRGGAEHLAHTATAELGDARTSLRATLDYLWLGWSEHGVGRLNAVGIHAGLASDTLGPAYANAMLEPLLQGFEARIARHVALGELEVPDLRVAALQLAAPVVLALLHQDQLGGRSCRPLELEALLEAQVDAFMTLYGC